MGGGRGGRGGKSGMSVMAGRRANGVVCECGRLAGRGRGEIFLRLLLHELRGRTYPCEKRAQRLVGRLNDWAVVLCDCMVGWPCVKEGPRALTVSSRSTRLRRREPSQHQAHQAPRRVNRERWGRSRTADIAASDQVRETRGSTLNIPSSPRQSSPRQDKTDPAQTLLFFSYLPQPPKHQPAHASSPARRLAPTLTPFPRDGQKGKSRHRRVPAAALAPSPHRRSGSSPKCSRAPASSRTESS